MSWRDNHLKDSGYRLNQCLQLRRFESQFKEVHMNMTANIRDIQEMTELGDSVKRVDTLKEELENFAKMVEVSFLSVLLYQSLASVAHYY